MQNELKKYQKDIKNLKENINQVNNEFSIPKFYLIYIFYKLKFIPNISFKFIKEQFGELIIGDPQFNEKAEIKQVEIKSKNIFEGKKLLK
jgi:hypothetical protein